MKVIFDNNLSPALARALQELFKGQHEIVALRDKFRGAPTDLEWITELSREGIWIVISGDYRIGKSAHERRAWHESGLTAFFLSKGWTNIPPLQQHSKLALILENIIEQAQRAKPGSGFSVSMNGKIQQVYP